MAKHYVNEVGTDLILDTGVLIGSATAQHIKYRKPDGLTIGTFTASLFSSTSALAGGLVGTYLIKHTLAVGELNVPGEWRFQAYVGSITGSWLGEMAKINIYDSFQ
jgi:hypothetical protein